jgi:hypothetical protein
VTLDEGARRPPSSPSRPARQTPEKCRALVGRPSNRPRVVRTIVGLSRSSSSPTARPDGSPPTDSPAPSRFA